MFIVLTIVVLNQLKFLPIWREDCDVLIYDGAAGMNELLHLPDNIVR